MEENCKIENTVQTKCTFCGGVDHFSENNSKGIRQGQIFCSAGHSDNRQTERTPWKTFRCGSQDQLIAKFPKPLKKNEKRRKQVHFNKKVNCACDKGKNTSNQKIYESMARISVH